MLFIGILPSQESIEKDPYTYFNLEMEPPYGLQVNMNFNKIATNDVCIRVFKTILI